ncbi:uncharacterized protein PAC_02458 [Phialocephala subalpina]|uniref:2EXR domain-containing protein n=1 Tax=Phialocephala subalpina TaxID=576137 RepID=A0A1L7WII3_9HELO|nr:uncharacterized protein PAC_02458 [Phialocephala subalpina]
MSSTGGSSSEGAGAPPTALFANNTSHFTTPTSAHTHPESKPEFIYFTKVPTEVRQMIWALVAPEPAVVVQARSRNPGRQFHYIRSGGVPAVLHTCQESRAEYIQTDDPKEADALARRRRAHPVYKLYSDQGKRTRNGQRGFYMDVDHDSMWGLYRTDDSPHWSYIFDGSPRFIVGHPSLKSTLKHLIIAWNEVEGNDRIRYMVIDFPALETLTIVLPEWQLSQDGTISVPCDLDGTLVAEMLQQYAFNFLTRVEDAITDFQDRWEIDTPEKGYPDVTIRVDKGFINTKHIELPEPLKNPLEDMMKEMKGIKTRRTKAKHLAEKLNNNSSIAFY